tara:strand:- start:569 stop:769 length:201 start_codon:yes stop_codon:yes gene_type:complete
MNSREKGPRKQIYMVLRNPQGTPLDVANGIYAQADIHIFEDDGYVHVDRETAEKASEEMGGILDKP